MSRVVKRLLTELEVEFDAEFVDPETGEIVHQAPWGVWFKEGEATETTTRFPARREHGTLVVNLRLRGALWRSMEVEMPRYGTPGLILLRAHFELGDGEWDALIAMAEETAA